MTHYILATMIRKKLEAGMGSSYKKKSGIAANVQGVSGREEKTL